MPHIPHISIKAEKIVEIFGITVTNSFLLSTAVLLFFAFLAIKYHQGAKAAKKTKLYYFFNFILKNLFQLFSSVLKEKTEYFFPLIASFFLFILLQNWFGLLPGVGSLLVKTEDHGKIVFAPLFRGNNADLNATLSLALISVSLIQIFAIKFLGFGGYFKKFYNLANPISLFTGTLEIISEISKVISFSFRLFGNIFAGEVLLVIMAFLIPVIVSFPFLMLEVFVGFIQALVFAMLTAVFLSVAISKAH